MMWLQLDAPRHVALICDGSGRWAQRRHLTVTEGHGAAASAVISRIRDALELGIAELTIYAFSTENWARPEVEVSGLVELLRERIEADTPALRDAGVRIRFIGRSNALPQGLRSQMLDAENETRDCTSLNLYVALNYGGRAEIIDAARCFRGGSEQDFRELLYAPEMADPELVIRTGGERRLSNYLLWQAAYSELVFRDELWPDFNRAALEHSLSQYAQRNRRFGAR
jgi:undecaprenyl diphosphate synthase